MMSDASFASHIARLNAALHAMDTPADAPARLEQLVCEGLDTLPMPGAGATLARWQALAAVAEQDLSLAKLYEGHTDALAIQAELHSPAPAGGTWGVWASESPRGRTTLEPLSGDAVTLHGTKHWCSGAATGSHALLTAWHNDGRGPFLVRLPLRQSRITVHPENWRAVGMAGSASLEVRFEGAKGELLGSQGAYLQRSGFWHGGAGIAACWYGGARGLAEALRRALAAADGASRSPWWACALGKVDAALQATAAVLRDAARWIDLHPTDDAAEVALRARLVAEACAELVLRETGRALGAAAYCRDGRFARAAADLPVFIRQSHGERDFAALGDRVLLSPQESAWML